MAFKYDFSGWATKNDLLCSDGRTIRHNAFKDNDGKKVPLVWNHDHSSADNVMGHALLINRDEGVYAYCSFNDTPQGQNGKRLVAHGDIASLSIWANKLVQRGGDVLHGDIKEVSLVLAGANPGAFIDSVMIHGEDSEDEAVIFTGEEASLEHGEINDDESELEHSDGERTVGDVLKTLNEEQMKAVEYAVAKALAGDDAGSEGFGHADADEKDSGGKTVGDVLKTFNEEQKKALMMLIQAALEKKNNNTDTEGDNKNMKHNLFDKTTENDENVLSQADVDAAFADVKRYGSLRDSFAAHGIDEIEYIAHADGDYGINNIDYLFPEARAVSNTPDFIKREDAWVRHFMGKVGRTAFSRIKSVHANIAEDEARARGYIKGNLKKEEVFGLLRRTTTPTTIYKKQKLDRDDVIDITDIDVVAFMKGEMRGMLDEEIARAALLGDQRSAASEDKINEQCIRPIWTDDDLYTSKYTVSVASTDTDDDKAINLIRTIIKKRKDYKGSGNPVLYTTEDMLSDMLLITDSTGRDIYDTPEKLMRKLRVSDIVTVPVMENLTRSVDGDTHTLAAILVNLADYKMGADKGGGVNMFDDFDIDYNQMKYLIETRCSGALVKPYSAQVFEFVDAA